MIFIEIALGWFLLSIIFMITIGILMILDILEGNDDKLIYKFKIFVIGIVVIFIVSVILMILSLSTV